MRLESLVQHAELLLDGSVGKPGTVGLRAVCGCAANTECRWFAAVRLGIYRNGLNCHMLSFST